MMMNAWMPMSVVRPAASSFSNGASAPDGDAQAGADDQQERDEDRRRAEQAELLADRGEDDVGLDRGDLVGSAETEPGAGEAAAGQRERAPR